MEYDAPKEKSYVAEGNVIISFKEYNKLNDAMENLKKDKAKLLKEQNKLNKAIEDKVFLNTHTRDRLMYGWYGEGFDYIDYNLSDDAEELLKPITEQRTKEAMRKAYKEFSTMTWVEFKQWRKDYKGNIFNY